MNPRENPSCRADFKKYCFIVLCTLVLLISLDRTALALRLTVTVTRPTSVGNLPIPDAEVCANVVVGSIIATAVTDVNGIGVLQNVPAGTVRVVASSSRYKASAEQTISVKTDQNLSFILIPGTAGPACSAPVGPREQAGQQIQRQITINGFNAQFVGKTPQFFEAKLSFAAIQIPGSTVVTPTHYRFGENSDLSGVSYTPYAGTPALQTINVQLGHRAGFLTAYGARVLFLQVRVGNLESNVAFTSFIAQPERTVEFRIERMPGLSVLLSPLRIMLLYAQGRGFQIGTRVVSATSNVGNLQAPGLNLSNLTLDTVDLPCLGSSWETVDEINLLEVGAKRFTPGWRVKTMEVGPSSDVTTQTTQAIINQIDGNGFRVQIRLRHGACPVETGTPAFAVAFPFNAVVLEGPADDLFVDPNNPWKNMFP